jgi:hypothetical protein
MIDRARAPRRASTFNDPATLSAEYLQRSLDREDAIREARAAEDRARGIRRRSTSDIAPRCATCGQWPVRDWNGMCRGDGGFGHPYTPSEVVGLAVVR